MLMHLLLRGYLYSHGNKPPCGRRLIQPAVQSIIWTTALSLPRGLPFFNGHEQDNTKQDARQVSSAANQNRASASKSAT